MQPRLVLLAGAILALLVSPACAQNADAAAGSGDVTSNQQFILVTGSTDGLGREVALRLAARGAHVIVHGRNRERGEALVEEISASRVGSARFYAADLASLEQVRAFADAILRDYDRLDVLVNNAGIWLRQDARQVSEDGHELHFAVNYLAGYALTHMLLPLLSESAQARIVNVASAAQTPIDFSDPMLEGGYSGGRAYAQSKLAQIVFTVDLARALAATGVTVVALHPATLMDTEMVREAGVRARSTVEEGAEAVMNAITSADVESGAYFEGLERTRADAQAYDTTAQNQLRALSARLTGVGSH